MTSIENTRVALPADPSITVEAGGGGTTSASLATAPLMPEPSPAALGTASITTLAALLTQADAQDRTAARRVEDEAGKAAATLESQRVQELEAKASQDLGSAIASGAGDIVGGGLTATSGFVSDGSVAQPGQDPATPSAEPQIQPEVQPAPPPSPGTNWRSVTEGAGHAVPGAGTLVAGGFKAEGDRNDARAAEAEAMAQATIRRLTGAHEDVQAANDAIQKVAQLLQTVQQTVDQTRVAAASVLRG